MATDTIKTPGDIARGCVRDAYQHMRDEHRDIKVILSLGEAITYALLAIAEREA